MKYIATLLLAMTIMVGSAQVESPSKGTWKTLGKITFKKVYDELMGFKVDMPVFSDQIVALEGKEITVKGYMYLRRVISLIRNLFCLLFHTICVSSVEVLVQRL